MNRVEALEVMHEILVVLGETVMMNSLSLDCAPKIEHLPSGFYEIKIKCELDSQSRECLQTILDRHRLLMKEDQGILTIFRHQP